MAVLSISNGKNEIESVKILSGEVWKIDKYTTEFEDSYEIRQLNQMKFEKFQLLYPNAGRGSVRLFLPPKWRGESRIWTVFYKKHKVAFSKVLCDEDFMRYYARYGSRYLTFHEKNAIENYPKQLEYCMETFCHSLLMKDEKARDCKGGGPLYFGFMRDILYRYLIYSRKNSNAKTIDQLYAEYYREIESLTGNNEQIIVSAGLQGNVERDPDDVLYDVMDSVENRYSKLQGFLSNPNFERYYGSIFNDGYLFILGNSIQEYEQKEIYKKWYAYGEQGFDGIVVCPTVSKNSGYIDRFQMANIVFFCVFRSDLEVEKMISLAIINQAEVVIQLYDESLYPRYSKKYPQAIILLSNLMDEDTLLDETDDFMINCYNKARGKRYQK